MESLMQTITNRDLSFIFQNNVLLHNMHVPKTEHNPNYQPKHYFN